MAIILDGTSGETLAGNLNFTGTGNRITGDMSNATTANRLGFQSSTTNGDSLLIVVPNGTSTSSSITAYNNSTPNQRFSLICNSAEARLASSYDGAGPYLPMTFLTGGAEQMRIATDGTVTGTKGNLQLISGTAVASTSGTSIDFTGIPSWVKKLTVIFNGVGTNGSSNILVQIGSGSVTTSGYSSGAASVGNAIVNSTAGFIQTYAMNSTNNHAGSCVIYSIGSNVYASSGTLVTINTANNAFINGGSITLGGALDRVRITTVNGTDAFDAGSINIMYE